MALKCYSELILLPTFKERFEYLKLNGSVAIDTFGGFRYLNQALYTSARWKELRKEIIFRDLGCDLGVDGYSIPSLRFAVLHHINPLTKDDLMLQRECIFDPENLITTTRTTHNAIHYGDESVLMRTHELVVRSPMDQIPWAKHREEGGGTNG